MKFKPGDIVILKSGGPDMTVDSANDIEIACIWFDGKRQIKKTFRPETLKKRPRIPRRITLNFVDAGGRVVSTKKLDQKSN